MAKTIPLPALQAAFGALVLALSGCSDVLGIESERTLDDRGNELTLPAEWSCLGEAVPAASSAAMLTQTLHFYDVTVSSMGQPISGLTVRACPRIDFDCATPISAAVTSNEGGIAAVSVPTGFNGYYEVSGRAGYQPYIVVESTIRENATTDVPVAPLQISAAYASAAGTTLDDQKGILLMTIRNCDDVAVPGVSFDVSSSGAVPAPSKLIYLVNSLPTGNAQATDSSGAAVIFNIAPGAINATAKASDGTFTIATRSGPIRAGWETQLHFYPDQLEKAP